ncbi:MAG: Lrp/AsnC ligand binding domain-containing protein [bacterium]
MGGAYILVKTQAGKAGQAVKSLRKIKNVVRADSVTGPYDIIAYAQADNINTLGKMIVSKIQTIPGVVETMTCLAVDV